MELKLKKQKLTQDELWQEVSAQQTIETEITLPDYCGDIKRILKCIMLPGITNISVSGENTAASGKVSIKLIYVNEKDKIDCYEGMEDLSVSAVIKDLPDNSVIAAEAKTNYVNCRAVSQRKITIEGNIAVIFKIFSEKNTELPEGAEGMGVQCRKKQVQYEHLICRKEKVFDLGETAKVPQGKAPIGKILCVSARAVLDSKKAVADKLLIKGEMYADILYLSEGEEGKTEKMTHSMPISQIIDMPGIDENSLCSVVLKVRQIEALRKADSSSQGNMLDIAAKCSATVKCSEIKTVSAVDDCYSVSHDIKSDYTIHEFSFPIHTMDEQKTIVKTLDIPSGDISSVLHIWCSDLTGTMKGKGDKAKANCTAVLGILYLDSKGIACFTEKNADFEISCKLKESYEYLRCELESQMRSIEWKVIGKEKLEIKMKIGILCNIYSSESLRVLSNMQVLSEKQNAEDTALTLYFSMKDENLWDIAKKYNTTKSAIQTENDISGDTAPDNAMILIPCAG